MKAPSSWFLYLLTCFECFLTVWHEKMFWGHLAHTFPAVTLESAISQGGISFSGERYFENQDLGAIFISVYIKNHELVLIFPVSVFVFQCCFHFLPFQIYNSLLSEGETWPQILSVFTYDQSPGCSQIPPSCCIRFSLFLRLCWFVPGGIPHPRSLGYLTLRISMFCLSSSTSLWATSYPSYGHLALTWVPTPPGWIPTNRHVFLKIVFICFYKRLSHQNL